MSANPQIQGAGNTVFLPGSPVFHPGGVLGQVLAESVEGRLRKFIVDASSEPLFLFSNEGRAQGTAGDWYGEHVGKWLIAASRAAYRTEDDELGDRVLSVADCLCRCQEADGYLGTYAPDAPCRFTDPCAEGVRTWDVWVHAYAMLGLLEVHRHWPSDRLLNSVKRIAELLHRVFAEQGRDITRYGNHDGLSSLIVIQPLAELAISTGDSSYGDLAEALAERGETRLHAIEKLLGGGDIAEIGTGKIYQLIWLLHGFARLHRATGKAEYLAAAKAGWRSVREHHLTLGGGPWGGVGRHKEVFNDAGFFSPYGLVETCSVMAWMQLCRELLEATGDPIYAEEFDKAVWNSLLGAVLPGGEDWSYYTFPNGRRNPTYYWACCKSSGAIALEEIPLCGAASFSPGRFSDGGEVESDYPFDGDVLIRSSGGPLKVRIPSWAAGVVLEVDGERGPQAILGEFLEITGSTVRLRLPMKARVHAAADTLDHHGHEIARRDYFAVTRGPLVYAAGLLDGFKTEETLKAPCLDVEKRIEGDGHKLTLNLPGRGTIELRPYYEAGSWAPGTWRATWLGVQWQ